MTRLLALTYLQGWDSGVKMIEAGFTRRECLSYASFMIRLHEDEAAQGFFDAIMTACGG